MHISLGSLIGWFFGVVIAIPLLAAVNDRRHKRIKSRAVQGIPFTLPVAMRRADRRGLAGSWRWGRVLVSPDVIVWTPRFPWRGQAIVMRDVTFGRRRIPRRGEYVYFYPNVVIVSCSVHGATYELAGAPQWMHYIPGVFG